MSLQRACFAVLIPTILGTPALSFGQESGGSQCPPQSGVFISSTSRGNADNSAQSRAISLSNVVDTSWAFNVAQRSWQVAQLDASIVASLSNAQSPGTSGASAFRSRGPLHACIGIGITMDQPTLVMTGVSGQVHLQADITSLLRSFDAATKAITGETRR